MKGLWKLTWTEIKLFLRDPIAAFFTLIFPLMMLFLFGSIYGNKPSPLLGGYGSVDVSVPAYTAMIIATSGIVGLPISLASYRERGILRRFRATPLHPLAVLIAEVIVIFIATLLGMALLIIAGKLFYDLHFFGNPINVLAAFILSSLSFSAIGFILASIIPSARTTQIVSMVILYPMLFLSGAGIPRQLLPKIIQKYSQVLPLTHVVTLLQGLWFGESWREHLMEVRILIAILIIGIILSSRIFRWE